MKIRIIDLMDYYYGDGVKLDTPGSPKINQSTSDSDPAVPGRTHRMQKPLLIAAALLLVVTAGVTVPFALSRTVSGNAFSEGKSTVESVLETLPPQLPAAISSDSSQEDTQLTPEATTQPQGQVTPMDAPSSYVIEGTVALNDQLCPATSCEGNLLYVDSTYYTTTENGPETVAVQTLDTTIDLYGTWKLRLDYAVIGGELAFRNLDAKAGEGIATAELVSGSADTVLLTLMRTDKNLGADCYYKVLYNIKTGEITDPLAKVPDLFDHGDFDTVQFNSDFTRAIVRTYFLGEQDGVYIPAEDNFYICDLTIGQMQSAAEVVGIEENWCDSAWADDDTMLVWSQDGDPETSIHTNLYSYNAKTKTAGGRLRDEEIYEQYPAFDPLYIHSYQFTDDLRISPYGLTCPNYHSGATPPLLFNDSWDTAGDRVIMATGSTSLDEPDNSLTIYLHDDGDVAWARLSDYVELPPEDEEEPLLCVRFVSEDWFCLISAAHVYCYRIPDDLPMTSWVD